MAFAKPADGAKHGAAIEASDWVIRFAPLIPARGRVLDLAAGHGRHARHLAGLGFQVDAVDRDHVALAGLRGIAGVTAIMSDVETGPWPLAGRRFGGVVVTNYLWRSLLPAIMAALADDGVLIYETFAMGNERLGKPSNPEFLLRPGELLEQARLNRLDVIAYENGFTTRPRDSVVQRICARKGAVGAVPASLGRATR